MRGQAEHEDVGARAEDAIARAGHDHRADLGVLETDALERVVQLDIDAEVVRVELELVTLADARILRDVHCKARDAAVDGELPVAIARGIRPVIHFDVLHAALLRDMHHSAITADRSSNILHQAASGIRVPIASRTAM